MTFTRTARNARPKNRHNELLLASIAAVFAIAFGIPGASASAATPQLVATGDATCALLADGSVKCFGVNAYGELGNTTHMGGALPTPTPTTVVGLGNSVQSIGGGNWSVCAVMAGGGVKCFGRNQWGELANTTNNGSSTAGNPDPVDVPLVGAAVAADSQTGHTCVVLADGHLWCFGKNESGQNGNATGNGASDPHPVPTDVGLPGNVRAVSTGSAHTCVLLSDPGVSCFGNNMGGALGNATGNGSPTAYPVPASVVLGGGTPTAVSAGNSHTCVLLADGGVRCFGNNFYGMLGRSNNVGTTTANPTAALANIGFPVTQISAGGAHTCALIVGGSVMCWGKNQNGQMGVATNFGVTPAPANYVPERVELGGTAGAVSAGESHTCVQMTDGAVKCFGDNTYGQLGNSFASSSYLPITVAGLDLSVPKPPPPAAATSKLSAKIAKPRLKTKLKGKHVLITSVVTVSATGIAKATCTGKLSVTAKSGKKRVTSKKFSLKFAKNHCTASVKLSVAKKYKGKKLKFSMALSGSTTLSSKSLSITKKL